MRTLIVCAVVLLAAPSHTLAAQRDRSERTASGRSATPRQEGAERSASEGESDRRAQRREDAEQPALRERASDSAEAARSNRTRRGPQSTAETVRERWREQRPAAAPARNYWTNAPRMPGGPASIALPDHGLRPLPDRENRRRQPGDPGVPVADDRPHFRRPRSGANVVFVPYAAPVVVEREIVVERDAPAPPPVIIEPPSLARLILEIHPPSAQVFADGYYIGIPEDFEGEGAVLEPGPHRIDILARGYQPVSFEVNLARGQSATFRHVLMPAGSPSQPAPEPAPKAAPAPKQPATFYLIPGCYMGNVPPKDAKLPATCDTSRAVTMQY